MGEATVKKGTKITREEAKSLDRTKMGVGITKAPEVEGQELYVGLVECPWCRTLNRVILDTNYYVWWTCGGCGGHYRN